MPNKPTAEELIDIIISANTPEDWQTTIDRYGPLYLNDLSLIKQFGDHLATLQVDHEFEAEKLAKWAEAVDAQSRLKTELLSASSDEEISSILSSNRDAIGPELVVSALSEVPHLIADGSPFPPQMGLQMAMRLLHVSMMMSQFLQDDSLMAQTLRTRSLLYIQTGEQAQAVKDLKNAIDLLRAAGKPIELGRSMGILGGVLREQGELDEALYYQQKAASLFLENNGQRYLRIAYGEIAKVYLDKGETEKSLAALAKSEEYRQKGF